MTAGTDWIDPPVVQHQLPAAVPALPAPPADVTDGVSALRVACAKWAPHPGVSDHQAEVQACDVVLNRSEDFPIGVTLGVCGTLAFVGFVNVSKSLIQARASSRRDNIAFFTLLGLVGVLAGYVASWPITWARSNVWTDAQGRLAVAGCIVATIGLLFALRWNTQREVAA